MKLLPVLLFLSQALEISAQTVTTVVDLGYTKYEGSLNDQGNVEFLGMRFAAAPTGSLRWRAPRAPEATPGIQKANAFGNECFQSMNGMQPTTPFPVGGGSRNNSIHQMCPPQAPSTTSEDCLFLNVFTPASGKKGLPVVVWIHGGGYVLGNSLIYDGNDLIRQAGGGVVVVTIQYRLGLFGFLAGQKIHDNGALNAGLLDQQFALRWVQQHIGKFNGDPRKVTIWGESAGAGSVIQHVVANNGYTQPPLFHGAITSSTFLPSQYKFNDRIPELLYQQVVNAAGCSSAKSTLSCLRDADAHLLMQVNCDIAASAFFGVFLFVPVVDGRLITKRPTQLLREGRVNGEALLAITNTFEGFIFVNESITSAIQTPQYVANLFPEFRPQNVTVAAAQYANLSMPFSRAIAIMGESIFICPTYYLLRAFKNKGFKGEFAVPPGIHIQDVAYYFPNSPDLVPAPRFNNTEFINNFAQLFLNFVLALDPNVKWDPTNTLPQWTKWSQQGRAEMLFNMTEAGDPVFRSITTESDLLERCRFWESAGPFSAQ